MQARQRRLALKKKTKKEKTEKRGRWRRAIHFEYLFVKFHDNKKKKKKRKKKHSLIKIMPLDERTIGFIVIHTSFKEQIQRQNKTEKKKK